jgi:hypothetical protein
VPETGAFSGAAETFAVPGLDVLLYGLLWRERWVEQRQKRHKTFQHPTTDPATTGGDLKGK